MIYESFVWKKELKKELNNFRKMVVKIDLSEEPGIPDNINLKVEKFFFVSAFIIRKLNEAKKLSNELNGINISVDHFKRINKEDKISFRNNHNLERFYDLKSGGSFSLSLAELCNMFIHSFVFKVVVSDKEDGSEKETVKGVLVNSDYSKDRALYYIELENFFKIVEETINDDVVFSFYDYETNKVFNSRKHPPHDLKQFIEQSFEQSEHNE